MDQGSKLSADIPFGIEERDIANEPYGKQTQNVVDNIERLWEGIFTAKSWVHYHYQGAGNALIAENCGHYFLLDKEQNEVSILLTRVIDYEKCEDWMRHSHPSIDCRGRHHFKYSLCLQDTADDLLQAVRLAKQKASLPEAEPLIGGEKEQRVLPAKASILDVQGDSAVISAFFREGDQYFLRLYEAKGVCSKLQVKSAGKILSVMPVDFNGGPIDRAPIAQSPDGFAFETDLRPWEILTLQISLVL